MWGGAASECGWTSNLQRSMGWSCVSLSSVRGGGVEGFIAVAFSWNWNWRACEAEGYEFWGERERRERISSLKKWKQQHQPFLVLAQMK